MAKRNMYRLPPAGGFPTVAEILKTSFLSSADHATAQREMNRQFSREHVFVNSGKTALFVTFLAMARICPKRTIAMPSFTCPDIAAAAIRAGYKVLPLEQDLGSIDIALDSLRSINFDDIAAIVLPNLFGLPDDIGGLRIAIPEEVMIIDDACQSLLSSNVGQRVGFRKEAIIGVWSAGRGKALCSAGGGGVICGEQASSEALFEILKEIAENFPNSSVLAPMRECFELLLLSILEHPRLFWIPASLPWLGIGKVTCRYDFQSRRPSDQLISYSFLQWKQRTETIKAVRNRVIELQNQLRDVDIVQPYLVRAYSAESIVSPVRYPIICRQKNHRDAIFHKASEAGLGVSASYGKLLKDFSEIESKIIDAPTESAHHICQCLLTLPIHEGLTDENLQRLVRIIKNETSN